MSQEIPTVDEWAQCVGKEAFDTWELANKVMRRRHRVRKGENKVYKCPHCHKFHMSSTKFKHRRNRRRRQII